MSQLLQLDLDAYNQLLVFWIAAALLSGIAMRLLDVTPISGRSRHRILNLLGHMDKRRGWILMETPVLLVVIAVYWAAGAPRDGSLVLLAAFVAHYVNRALIYPYRVRVTGKTMPVLTVVMVMLFYTVNGYLVGYYLGGLQAYPVGWLSDPRFIIGALLFVTGMAINITSDNILIGLRQPGETEYKIPRGGLFRYVSCPHYFGEIIEWIGFALMIWAPVGVAYALWVILPLLSQASSIHRWYLRQFPDRYPAERKAVIPGLF